MQNTGVDTAHLFVGARVLDVNRGRFISRDPAGRAGGGLDPHRYVGNRPTFGADPSGANPACLACVICLGAAALVALIGCATDRRGLLNCVACWCATNPVACGALVATCSVTCRLCFPALAAVPIYATATAAPLSEPLGLGRANCQALLNECLSNDHSGDCGCCFRFCVNEGRWPYDRCNWLVKAPC